MKIRMGFLVTCAASAVAIGLGLAAPARAADVITKAPPIAVTNPEWWYEGFAEVGGRFDLNDPDKTTLGKFYEYRDLRPGVYGNFFAGWHRTNEIDPYDIEIWGKDIGWDDQAFGLDLASPGSYYLTFGWDETPHVYWRNAKTLYNGVGSNVLTIPSSVSNALSGTIGTNCANNSGGITVKCPSGAAQAIIDGNSRTIGLDIRRDTASVQGRWTPTDNWDVYGSYSHMDRYGTQALGAVSFSGSGSARSTFEIPRPIDDTTQNADLKAEYSGSTAWGKQFNIALAGGVSTYENNDPYVIFQNPWNPVNHANQPLNNLYSLEPNNQAQNVTISGGMGLPINSRYMGTLQFTHMQVDDATLPWTINPDVPAVNYVTPNRDANTVLWNNVLHTDITSDLKSTLRYRYYDYSTANPNPVIVFPPWYANPDTNGNSESEEEIRYPRDFTKQNADAQLVWRPSKWLNIGAAYDWERWARGQYRDAPTTNENSGRVFADSQWGWSTVRASFLYGERRYNSYMLPPVAGGVTDGFRMKDLANRDRYKGQFSWAIVVTNMITVTPNGGFLDDDYQTNFNYFFPTEAGLKKAQSWNAGADLSLNFSPDWSLYFSYNYENGIRQVLQQGSQLVSGNNPGTGVDDLNIETTDGINTFIVGSKFTVIPSRLYLDANFTYMKSTSQWDLGCTPAGCRYGATTLPPNPLGLATYPDIHNTLTRLDVQALYWLDDTFLHNAGFIGRAYVKGRVLWEKNENDSWQSLQNQFGQLVNPINSAMAYSIWMGTGNPNYDAVVGMLAFGVKW